MLSRSFSAIRLYSQAVKKIPPIEPTVQQYPYFVPRNSRGSLPVYTDIRNGGTRHLVLIRNVDGDANKLAADLSSSLFAEGSPERERMRILINRSKHLVISGGQWKNQILAWLVKQGF